MVSERDLDTRARLVAWGYVADRYAILLTRLKSGRTRPDSPEFQAATNEAKELLRALARGEEQKTTAAFDSLSVHGATASAYYQAERHRTEDWTRLLSDIDNPGDIDDLRSIFDGIGLAMSRAAQQAPARPMAYRF